MVVSAWSGGSGTYGIRVGLANRKQWFKREWTAITVEIDGTSHRFELTPSFWKKCPEFRDSGGPIIKEWLRRHGLLHWDKGNPPKLKMDSLGDRRFRLTA